MRKSLLTLLVALIISMAVPVQAEIYRYTDENGQKRWTDDLSQVPKDQRATAQHVESVGSAAQTQPETAETPLPSPAATDAKVMPDEADAVEAPSREALEQERAELNARYQKLLAEKKILEKMNTEPMDSVARADLNQRILDYNKKTEQYETQLNLFNEKISAYNQKISSQKPKTPAD